MKRTIIAATIASVAGIGSGYYSAKINTPAPVVVRPAATGTAAAPRSVSGKPNRLYWGDLAQNEIDALTAEINKLTTKKPVVIFCSDSNCQDMVLDFDNAFESAHWETDIQKPFIDSAVGLWSSSKEIASAIETATAGRLKVSILGPEWSSKDKIALAIGKKPR